jgi:hypothetical protein
MKLPGKGPNRLNLLKVGTLFLELTPTFRRAEAVAEKSHSSK